MVNSIQAVVELPLSVIQVLAVVFHLQWTFLDAKSFPNKVRLGEVLTNWEVHLVQ